MNDVKEEDLQKAIADEPDTALTGLAADLQAEFTEPEEPAQEEPKQEEEPAEPTEPESAPEEPKQEEPAEPVVEEKPEDTPVKIWKRRIRTLKRKWVKKHKK